MNWRTVFGVVPVPVFYVDTLAEGVGGEARGPVIRIRAELRGDEGCLQHELEHVQQFWITGVFTMLLSAIALSILAPLVHYQDAGAANLAVWCAAVGIAAHPVLYKLSRGYRLFAEANAYRAQMNFRNQAGGYLSLEDAAAKLAGPRYDLRITLDQAREILGG